MEFIHGSDELIIFQNTFSLCKDTIDNNNDNSNDDNSQNFLQQLSNFILIYCFSNAFQMHSVCAWIPTDIIIIIITIHSKKKKKKK